MGQKELIKSLIKDYLISTKLVVGLQDLGLEALLNYDLMLADTLLRLMDISLTDKQHEHYIKLYEQVMTIDVKKDDNELNKLTDSIFNHLLELKTKQK